MKAIPTICALALLVGLIRGQGAEAPTLAERLGYKATDRLLIINGDDAGMCHAANVATIEALSQGLLTTATIMVPCPWFNEIANYARDHAGSDFGIHLCHTAEWKLYRWGPVAPREQVPGLVDPQGCLWPEIEDVYAHSNPEEALIEGRAQIRKALAAGVDVTHLDSHMGTLQYNAAYMESYLKLAVEFDLPLRMASQSTLVKFGQPTLREKFTARGLVFPDFFVHEELKDESKNVKGFWLNILKNLQPGVTEIYIHAGKPNEELQAVTGSWKTRGEQFETFTHDADIRKVIEDQKIIRIGYRPLRDLQRRSHAAR